MTNAYPPPVTGYVAPPDSSADAGSSTKDVAKDQAATVKQGAADAGQHVAGVAKEQAGQVTAEAGAQVKQLAGQAQTQVREQAGAQQQKLVTGLRSLSGELGSMARNAEQPGIASDLAHQAAGHTDTVAGWLDGREPADVLREVSLFARRRPGTFLVIAAGMGFLGGRLTRGLTANHGSDVPAASEGALPPATPVVTPVPVDTYEARPAELGMDEYVESPVYNGAQR